ncbi:DUF4339 domain-containing protein [Sulfurimonas sp.]|nr:DUF4339 domain-containing protein [Sulfurimonas sp.]
MLSNLKKVISVGVVTSTLLTTSLFADYHAMINNQQQGPFSEAKLQQMAANGSVTSDTLVWQAGMAGWEAAGTQQGLQNLFAAATPPPPPGIGMPPPAPSIPTPPSVAGQDAPVAQADVNEQNEMSDPKTVPTPSASDSVEDWSEDVLAKFGLSSFGEHNGKFVLFAQQSVSLKPTDPQYGDSVINAFDKAMMNLQEKYIMVRFGQSTVEKVRSMYSDRSTNAKQIELPEIKPGFLGKALAMLDKGMQFAEAKLDQELIGMGVSPEDIHAATPKEKKDLFRDKFVKNNIRKASGSVAGLVPVQTTIIRDSSGNTVIGLVAVASPKTLQIAKDITLQRESIIRGNGKDISSLLPSSNKEYLGTMGVRLVYDLDGSPAIMSYGMGSYVPDSGDDYINDELKVEAKNAAIANADAQIAEMINGRMNAKNERKNGEETRKYVEREMKPDSDTIEKTIKNIIKTTSKNSKSSASAKLQGISTAKTWRYTSKSGLKMVGAVRVWKYSTLKSINSFNKPKPKRKAKNSNTVQKKQNYNHFQQASSSVNTMDDF